MRTCSINFRLYFWIYRPHNLLSKYFNVCLFDDHGVDNLKVVSISQWMSNPRTLIVHGAGECDNEDSYISVVSVPKLGCLDCKQIHDEVNADPTECKYLNFSSYISHISYHTYTFQVDNYTQNCASNVI